MGKLSVVAGTVVAGTVVAGTVVAGTVVDRLRIYLIKPIDTEAIRETVQ